MDELPPFSELAFLSHIARESSSRPDARVLVGPGDDCAVIDTSKLFATSVEGRGSLLLKVDQVIEGKHFTPDTPLQLVARKAVARVVSDCAAMGGQASMFLAACVLPTSMSQREAEAFADYVHAACKQFGGPCVGGDVARTRDGPLSLSITALGMVHGDVLLRSSAKVGDGVYVTGTIGGSFAMQPTATDAFSGGGKHLHFVPRFAEAQWLKQTCGTRLHAMLDVSDGLGIDAGRIASASGVAIEIDASLVPLSESAKNAQTAVRDGEDYELLFTCGGSVPKACEFAGGVNCTKITRIGTVLAATEKEPAGSVTLISQHGSERIEKAGYQHR